MDNSKIIQCKTKATECEGYFQSVLHRKWTSFTIAKLHRIRGINNISCSDNKKDFSSSNRDGVMVTRSTHFFLKFLTLILILFMYCNRHVHAHSMDQLSSSSIPSYQHRSLGKRERREVQKEILSVLGLSHRPRPDGEPARGLQEESAPLYMLGLYNTVSGFSEIFNTRIQNELSPPVSESNSPQKRGPPLPTTNSHPMARIPHRPAAHSVGPFSDEWPTEVHVATNSAYYKFREAQMVFSNEVGIPEINERNIHEEEGTAQNGLLGDADVVMSFVARSPKGRGDFDETTRTQLKRHRPFYFKLDQIPNEDRLKGARFRVYKNASADRIENSTLRVNVYQVKRNDMHGQISLFLLASVRVHSMQDGWLSFDVYSAVDDWLKNTSDNLGLRVSVETLEGRSINLNKAGIVGTKRGDSSKRAFLVVFLTQGSKNLPRRLRRRIKRSLTETDSGERRETGNESLRDSENAVGHRQSESPQHASRRVSKRASKERKRKSKSRNRNRNRLKHSRDSDACHREELYVNFQDLNWDVWIIAPAGYRAYHCIGLCQFPLGANMNATNHAVVQTLAHLMAPEKLAQPCCSPTELEPISVLYYDDDNNVVYKKYTDMVVHACGCR